MSHVTGRAAMHAIPNLINILEHTLLTEAFKIAEGGDATIAQAN
jgi:hypothetical protein